MLKCLFIVLWWLWKRFYRFLAAWHIQHICFTAIIRKGRRKQENVIHQEEEHEQYQEWDVEETYRPESILDYKPATEKYQEPKYEEVYSEPVLEKPFKKLADKKDAPHIPNKVELYNPEVPAEEVLRNREIHAPHKHAFVASHEEEVTYSNFDFEDAIIKEAILNRPQY